MGGHGNSTKEGYVQVLDTNGYWNGICDDGFDLYDANVICTMLKFHTAPDYRGEKGLSLATTQKKGLSQDSYILRKFLSVLSFGKEYHHLN